MVLYLALPQLSDDLVDRLQRTKFEDWKYEDEMRVYVQLDRDVQESPGFTSIHLTNH